MNVIREISVKASAEKLWKILGEEYENVGEWTSEVLQSSANPDLGPGQGRICSTNGFGDAKETITEYDEKLRSLRYVAELEKMPFFVKQMANSWRVEPKGTDHSIVHMHMQGNLLPIFAQLMGPVMKRQMSKSADVFLEELKYYAENDRVHPRKQAQLDNASLQPV